MTLYPKSLADVALLTLARLRTLAHRIRANHCPYQCATCSGRAS